MVLIFCFALLLLFGCSDYERDNIYDQKGVNYGGQGVGGGVSSSVKQSSSSVSSSSFASSSASLPISYGTLPYEGQNYKTVKIGEQVWMAENLNYNASGSVCYDNNSSNCTTYGRLYNWATAMGLNSSCNSSTCASQVQTKHRGICPSGWFCPD